MSTRRRDVLTRARDPFHRIDIVHSSREVRIALRGKTIAESWRPYLLFERPVTPRSRA